MCSRNNVAFVEYDRQSLLKPKRLLRKQFRIHLHRFFMWNFTA